MTLTSSNSLWKVSGNPEMDFASATDLLFDAIVSAFGIPAYLLGERKYMKESDKLLEAVCETPEDWELRLVLADAYEEEGNLDYANCQRWMSVNRKRARISIGENHTTFDWWYTKQEYNARTNFSYIPEGLFRLLELDPIYAENLSHGFEEFPTRLESELAVMRVFGNYQRTLESTK